MKGRRKILLGVVVVALLVLLGATGAVMANPSPEEPGAAVSLGLPLASKISYQGFLTDDVGNPVNGTVDMVFQLWDDATAGGQVGSDIVKNGVPVSDGVFSVELDVPQEEFNGQALWLRVQVNGEWLDPRLELLPVPYALSLKPGAEISGASVDAVLGVTNTGSGVGVHGNSSGLLAAGVWGSHSGTLGFGVGGTASGEHGVGVGGQAENTGDVENYGGYFLADGSYGRGVYGEASNTGDVENYGGYFLARGQQGRGVYAKATGANAYAGYFEGDVHVTGELSGADGIARDSEIMPTVLANDGAGSGLDADLLDGLDSSDFLSTVSDYGREGVATDLYEDAQTLTVKYLNATGPDSMSGSTNAPDAVLSVTNTGTGYGISGCSFGDSSMSVYGQASGSSARGVAGSASGSDGIGVYGIASGSSGYGVAGAALGDNGYGVRGYASGVNGYGVYGHAAISAKYAGYFKAEGISGIGVQGEAANSRIDAENYGGYFKAAGGLGTGVYGEASNTGDVINYGGYFKAAGKIGSGIYGYASGLWGRGVTGYASGDVGYGVHASASGVNGRAVYGEALSSGVDAENYGGFFTAAGERGRGVYGEATDDGAVNNYGGYFTAAGEQGCGVYASATNTGTATNIGGWFQASGENGRGVYATATGSSAEAVLGEASNNDAAAENYGGWFSASGGLGRGVYGQAGGENGHGVHGTAFGSSGVGVYGYSTADTGYGGYFLGPNATGIYAKGSPTGYAAEFQGNVIIRDWSTGSPIIELGEGLDYAEGFEVSGTEGIGPGSVLVIDPENPGQLTLSREPYDSKVAGIVAGAGGLGSGVRLGSDEFDYDVALAGRVYCNVDATEEAVEPGDLLTTSASPGYAMKVTDYERAQGAILGKAMESLEKGEKGQILVLVTLQ